MRPFMHGFLNETTKLASLLTAIPLKAGLNLGEYTLMMKSPRFRKIVEGAGNAIMYTGLRHGLEGKRLGRTSLPAMIGAVGMGSAPQLIYEQGWNFGNKIRTSAKKLPGSGFVDIDPLKAIQSLDTMVQTGIKHSPAAGALAGAGIGGASAAGDEDRTVRKVIRGAAGGAMIGGGLGAAAKGIARSVPGPAQLHELRTKYVDRLMAGGEAKWEKWLDRHAKPV